MLGFLASTSSVSHYFNSSSLVYLGIIFDMCYSWTVIYSLTKKKKCSLEFLALPVLLILGSFKNSRCGQFFSCPPFPAWSQELWVDRNLIIAWNRKNSKMFTRFPVMTQCWYLYNPSDMNIKGFMPAIKLWYMALLFLRKRDSQGVSDLIMSTL